MNYIRAHLKIKHSETEIELDFTSKSNEVYLLKEEAREYLKSSLHNLYVKTLDSTEADRIIDLIKSGKYEVIKITFLKEAF